jgi:acetyl esterase/lipase
MACLLPLLALASASARSRVIAEHDVEYANPDNQHLEMDIACPDGGPGPFPAILCIHGGGWQGGERNGYDGLIKTLAGHGYVAASVDYRLAPKYPFPAAIHDVKAAVRWLRANAARHRIDPERIGVMGHSAGGHLSLLLGVTGDLRRLEGDEGNPGVSSRVKCVVSMAGPSDFTRSYAMIAEGAEAVTIFLGGDLNHARANHFLASPLCWVTPDAAPTLCVHGTEDELVAYEQSVWFVDSMLQTGVEAQLLTLPGAKHGYEGSDAQHADEAMLSFFDRHLKPSR